MRSEKEETEEEEKIAFNNRGRKLVCISDDKRFFSYAKDSNEQTNSSSKVSRKELIYPSK
jgi:hypothetical protein